MSCILRRALHTDGGTLCCHFKRDTTLVVFGTTMSAFWIVSLNSWMPTPDGFEVVNDKIMATNWLAIAFNPSFPYRFTHMLIASGLTASFVVAGVSAWQILKKVDSKATHKALKTALVAAAVLIPIQIYVSDLHGLNTLKHQPAKIAAMGLAMLLYVILDGYDLGVGTLSHFAPEEHNDRMVALIGPF